MRLNAKRVELDGLDVNIGSRMRDVRTSAGISLPTLASRIGIVSWQQLQKYETGQNRVSGSMMFRIACVLNVHPSTFFDDVVDPESGLVREDFKCTSMDEAYDIDLSADDIAADEASLENTQLLKKP